MGGPNFDDLDKDLNDKDDGLIGDGKGSILDEALFNEDDYAY